ncbi:MAG: prepilin-type N-terminal cleavage/methylation domain-containing protein [Isosphaeraceae bacterium]
MAGLLLPPLRRGGQGGFPGRASFEDPRARRAFTLIELLVVILIILIVSAVALPVVLPAFSHRQVSEAARILQGAFVGAHDNAIHNNQPSGIRLLPDPNFNGLNPSTGLLDSSQILACNRIIPIDPAPEYSEGNVSIIGTPLQASTNGNFVAQGGMSLLQQFAYPVGANQSYPLQSVLMVEESFYATGTLQPNPPTSWFWNIRVGDKIQINNAGPWYTVVGPMAIPPQGATINGTFYANPEMFVNTGPPGIASPLVRPYTASGTSTTYQPDFLFLVDGRDDNKNGWIDEGWDGVDNNGDGQVDEVFGNYGSEWETEVWQGAAGPSETTNMPYTIQRRPAPSSSSREIALPTNVVIDLTSWGSTLERSRMPTGAFNHYTGYVDIVVNPDGSVVPTTIYSNPATFGLGSAFIHLWLAERSDLYAPDTTQKSAPYLPLPVGIAPTRFVGGIELKGEYRLLTIFNRTGQSSTIDNMPFDVGNVGTTSYNTNLPYIAAQQGISGGP